MENCLFASPDRVLPTASVTPVLSGGSWLSALPLANLQDASDARMSSLARSTNAAESSTVILGDLSADRDIRLFSILRHNASQAATVRLQLYSDAARTIQVADTGVLPFWPRFYQSPSPLFVSPLAEMMSGYTGNPATASLTIGSAFSEVANASGNGGALALRVAGAAPGWYASTKQVYPVRPGRTYRLTALARRTADGASSYFYAGLTFLDANYQQVGAHAWEAANTAILTTADGWQKYTYTFTMPASSSRYVRGTVLANYAGGNGTTELAQLSVEDVTPPSLEDFADYTPDFWFAFDSDVRCRGFRVSISDTGNAAGYFQLARCLLAPAWQPGSNFDYGNGVMWNDATTSSRSLGDVKFYRRRAKYRSVNGTLAHIDSEEGARVWLEMQRRLGLSGEVFFVYDPDADTLPLKMKSFLASFRELSALENPYYRKNTAAFALEEVL